MDAVLAEALLAQCPASGALVRAVLGEGGPLSAEQAETLRFLLERAAAATAGGWRGRGDEGEAALRRLASETAWDLCLPALLGPDAGGSAGDSPEERRRLARAACRALRCCASLCGPPLAEGLAREALRACEGPERPRGEAAVEVLAAVAPWLEEPELLGQAVAAALRLLREDGEEEEEGEEARALLAAGRLLPALGSNAAAQGRVWEGLVRPPLEPPRRVSRTLLALSALSDAAFPGAGAEGEAAPSLDARRCGHFWRVVQKGLTESDALCRKRARYLLKRAVDVSGNLRWEGRCSPDPGNGTLGVMDTRASLVTLKGIYQAHRLVLQLLNK